MKKGQQTEQQYEDQEFADTAGYEKATKPNSNLTKSYTKAKDIMKSAWKLRVFWESDYNEDSPDQ